MSPSHPDLLSLQCVKKLLWLNDERPSCSRSEYAGIFVFITEMCVKQETKHLSKALYPKYEYSK